MRSVVVVVADVLGHQALKMAFVEDDDVIEQVSAAVADEAFGNAVLPRAAEAGPFGLDAVKAISVVTRFALRSGRRQSGCAWRRGWRLAWLKPCPSDYAA
jgi:N-acyl-D-aspartate/D-glutamate deacylase